MKPKLTDDQLETLRRLANADGRASRDSFALEARGLALNGAGRFGSWAKITEKGRLFLNTLFPVAAPGPAESAFSAGASFRVAGARTRRIPAAKRNRN